jgi:membrane associated rhomboid family serine protease
MIIPWGHDSAGPRRQPWVTYGILGLCLLVFLATHGLGDPVMEVAQAELAEAYDFWSAHPYLEPPERLVNRFGDLGAQARAEFRAAWQADGGPPVPADLVGQEQAELVFLVGRAETTLRGHVWFRWGLVPAAPTVRGLFGHLFLHGSWLHLLGSFLFLLAAGPLIEDRWGRGLFLLFFLAAGLAGAALFVFRSPGFDEPLIGASGAIAGAMGAYLVSFWRTQIRFVYWLGFFFGSFSAPAWLMLSLWFVHELASASLLEGQSVSGGIAHGAHVGGFLFGMASAGAVRLAGLTAIESPAACQLGPQLEGSSDAPTRTSTLPQTLLQAVGSGDKDGAIALWLLICGDSTSAADDPTSAAANATSPAVDVDTLLRLAGWLARGLDPVVALRAVERAQARGGGSEQEDAALAELASEARRAAEARGIVVLEEAPETEIEARDSPALALDDAPLEIEHHRYAAVEPAALSSGEPDYGALAAELSGDATTEPTLALEPTQAVEQVETGREEVPQSPEKEAVAPVPRVLRVLHGVPLKLDDRFLWLDLEEKGKTRLPLERVDAIAVAGVRGLPPGRPRKADGQESTPQDRPVLLIDLVLGWGSDADVPLAVVRLRSDRFDPRRLGSSPGDAPLAALRHMVADLMARTRATPLTAGAAGSGQPFRVYPDKVAYERAVLGARSS